MHIAVIGAGMMGHGIALSLLKHGHEVSVKAHRNRVPIDDLVSRGAREAETTAGIAEAQVIILCVSTSEVVAETIADLTPHIRQGHIIIDCGTSAPAVTRELAQLLATKGVAYADAPLTGGPDQAAKGELGVLCGAEADTFARIEPLLKNFATKVRHFGPPGSGHTAKLISNFLVTGMIALVTEAFTAARRADLDWRSLYDVMQNGSGNSGVLHKMMSGAFGSGFDGYRFSIANAAKDIGYYRAVAEQLDCGSELTEAVASVFAEALKAGRGGQNVSHLLEDVT